MFVCNNSWYESIVITKKSSLKNPLKVSFTLDYDNLLKSSIYYFYYYVLLLKTVSPEIINIESITDIKLFKINFESYFNIKKTIFESIEDLSKLEEDIRNIIDTNLLNFY